DHHGIAERRRATGEAGAAPAGDEGTPVPARDADRSGDLGRGSRPADRYRLPFAHTRVAPVQRELERFGTGTRRAERVAEVSQKREGVSDQRSLLRRRESSLGPVRRSSW